MSILALIIEDDEDLANIFAEALRGVGFTVEHVTDGKADLFDVLKPCLVGDGKSQPYAVLAEKLNLTESAVKTTIHRLRQRYRKLLREEISHTVASSSEVNEELRYLMTVLAR